MKFYQQKIYIAQVDKSDRVIGKVERWQAHTKGVLHRGFTIALFYKDMVIVQHRKHPVYDGLFDITISSHQMYINDQIQDDLTAVFNTLKREMNLSQADLLTKPKLKGKFYYKAKPTRDSALREHEIDYFFTCKLKRIPQPNYNFAYGISLMPLSIIKTGKTAIAKILAPWIYSAFKEEII